MAQSDTEEKEPLLPQLEALSNSGSEINKNWIQRCFS